MSRVRLEIDFIVYKCLSQSFSETAMLAYPSWFCYHRVTSSNWSAITTIVHVCYLYIVIQMWNFVLVFRKTNAEKLKPTMPSTGVGPDHPAQLRSLIWDYTGHHSDSANEIFATLLFIETTFDHSDGLSSALTLICMYIHNKYCQGLLLTTTRPYFIMPSTTHFLKPVSYPVL